MTHIYDDPARFKEDVIDGFAAAYARYVERVPEAAGFVRRGGPRTGKVSLVVGGGSGHYPSYAGIVGRGLADGCVLGDVFTSPSAEQIYRVGRAADGGAGLVLGFGNYAGDRLNFAAARERLADQGVESRIVYVTDDVASAPADQRERRRGVAGTAVVYKVGGAAADLGWELDAVAGVMAEANTATFSYGVAFAGCTLPGRSEPLFTVEPGQMEFGLGIHGEPGVSAAAWMPAAELAERLVAAVLAERPPGAGDRAAVILNGLGATKYEELFLLYRHVRRLLGAAGVTPVLPEVGELVTSLDMAGCSLSVTWLSDELAALWEAPVDTAAFRRGDPATFPSFPPAPRRGAAAQTAGAGAAGATEASRAAAGVAGAALAAAADAVAAAEAELGRLDAVAGDGDHGAGMTRGLRAAQETAAGSAAGAGSVLRAAGEAFADRAGGTSGILWGILLGAIGAALGDTDPVTPQRLATALRHGSDTLRRIGGAEPGDKTMVDALVPFVDALEDRLTAGQELAAAWAGAAHAAVAAAEATAPLTPKLGRARPLAQRSVGSPDAGATSMGMVLTAVGAVLGERSGGCQPT